MSGRALARLTHALDVDGLAELAQLGDELTDVDAGAAVDVRGYSLVRIETHARIVPHGGNEGQENARLAPRSSPGRRWSLPGVSREPSHFRIWLSLTVEAH